jgi:hypothetical protein
MRATLQQQQPATLPALTESHSAFTTKRLLQFCTLTESHSAFTTKRLLQFCTLLHSMAELQRLLLSPSPSLRHLLLGVFRSSVVPTSLFAWSHAVNNPITVARAMMQT